MTLMNFVVTVTHLSVWWCTVRTCPLVYPPLQSHHSSLCSVALLPGLTSTWLEWRTAQRPNTLLFTYSKPSAAQRPNTLLTSLQHFWIRPDGAGSRPTDCKSVSFCFISIPWIPGVKTLPRLRRCPWKTHSYGLQTLCGHVHCHRYHNSNYKFVWDLIMYISTYPHFGNIPNAVLHSETFLTIFTLFTNIKH